MEANQRKVYFDWLKAFGAALFYLKLSFIYVESIKESERIMYFVCMRVKLQNSFDKERLEVELKQVNFFFISSTSIFINSFFLCCCCYQTFYIEY